jgi:dynein heavy chain, axonemal
MLLTNSAAKNTEEATQKQAIAQEQEAFLAVETVKIADQKQEAEGHLAAALPALEEAAKALEELSKDDITEIRSFAKPHVLVQNVAECVAILKKFPETVHRFRFWLTRTELEGSKGHDG